MAISPTASLRNLFLITQESGSLISNQSRWKHPRTPPRSGVLTYRAGLSTRLTRLQPRAPTAQGAPERVMGLSLTACIHVYSGNPKN